MIISEMLKGSLATCSKQIKSGLKVVAVIPPMVIEEKQC